MIIELKRTYESRYGLPLVCRVDTLIFSILYPEAGCGPECGDICCSGGATMDILTFDKLARFRKEPDFRSIVWDGYRFDEDEDSPGGRGCYTRFDGGRCMFQNGDWGCSIHSFCVKRGIDVHDLKFFTCCMFPAEVNKIDGVRHVLTAGYELRHVQFDLPCKRNGDTAVYDISRKDIEFYYGGELLRELDEIRQEHSDKKEAGSGL